MILNDNFTKETFEINSNKILQNLLKLGKDYNYNDNFWILNQYCLTHCDYSIFSYETLDVLISDLFSFIDLIDQ